MTENYVIILCEDPDDPSYVSAELWDRTVLKYCYPEPPKENTNG